eukprot:6702459-Prymnesium_polylepis.2
MEVGTHEACACGMCRLELPAESSTDRVSWTFAAIEHDTPAGPAAWAFVRRKRGSKCPRS